MREVGQPGRVWPVAAHEWEPLAGSCALGPWPMEVAAPPEFNEPDERREVMMRQQQEDQPPSRRLVGIDLGIASRHSVRVLEAAGLAGVPVVVRAHGGGAFRGRTGRAGVRQRARGWRWCSKPTGPAWLPIAVFFRRAAAAPAAWMTWHRVGIHCTACWTGNAPRSSSSSRRGARSTGHTASPPTAVPGSGWCTYRNPRAPGSFTPKAFALPSSPLRDPVPRTPWPDWLEWKPGRRKVHGLAG